MVFWMEQDIQQEQIGQDLIWFIRILGIVSDGASSFDKHLLLFEIMCTSFAQ